MTILNNILTTMFMKKILTFLAKRLVIPLKRMILINLYIAMNV